MLQPVGKYMILFFLVLLFIFATLTPFVSLALRTKGSLASFIVIAVMSLSNVVLSGSPIAGYYPWTAAYLLLTGRIAQSGCPAPVGFFILFTVCLSGISTGIRRFQKEDLV